MDDFDDIKMDDFDDIKRMLDLMEAHGLEEFELERDGVRVRLKKPSPATAAAPGPGAPSGVSAHAVTGHRATAGGSDDQLEPGVTLVKSPIVGTFYRTAEPGADPFVEVGSPVRKGQVLCIIEAMKLMNEIDAEQDGEIVRIFVENGQPVQYGDTLFAIKMH